MRTNKRAPHPPETVERALAMREEGYTYREIGAAVGASPQTICTWCSPDRDRIRRREWVRKRKYTKPCIDCGGPTGYGKKKETQRCMSCHLAFIGETKKWTREAVISAIQRWDQEYGKPPTATDWNTTSARKRGRRERDKDLYPSAHSVYGPHAYFSTWADAIEAAGFPKPKALARGKPRKGYWTEERIVEALRAHATNGHGPMMIDWSRTDPTHPTAGWVVMVFGSWGNALEAAGLNFHPRSSGGHKRNLKTRLKNPSLTEARSAFVRRCMEKNVLKHYITRLMWKKWGYTSEGALKQALGREGVLEDPGWRYRFNRQLTQEEIEEGLAL